MKLQHWLHGLYLQEYCDAIRAKWVPARKIDFIRSPPGLASVTWDRTAFTALCLPLAGCQIIRGEENGTHSFVGPFVRLYCSNRQLRSGAASRSGEPETRRNPYARSMDGSGQVDQYLLHVRGRNDRDRCSATQRRDCL